MSPGTKAGHRLARAPPSGEETQSASTSILPRTISSSCSMRRAKPDARSNPLDEAGPFEHDDPAQAPECKVFHAVQSVPNVRKWLQSEPPYRRCVEGSLAATLAATTLQFNRDLTKCRPFAEISSRRGAFS